MEAEDIIAKTSGLNEEDAQRIAKAFDFARAAHEGQKRFSGEPYLIHPFHVALTLAQMRFDANTIIAGLLHDVCEDGVATHKDIEKGFGADVAFLVDGVTKLGTLRYHGQQRHAENLRKMFFAMAQDIRVILIKLADRLHNMQTLEHVPAQKQKRIADETLEIYAPIADRLGMGKFKAMLENLAFPFSFPEEYRALAAKIKDRLEKKEVYLSKVKYKLGEELKKQGVAIVDLDARIKNTFSLHKKLERHAGNLDEIHDLVALRVIVNTIDECYAALGTIHKLWKPLPGKIKDYIALPKPNGYQSIHTTVFCLDGEITEFQIRTAQMHEEAENGIAAHWAYSHLDKPKTGGQVAHKLAWVTQLRDWQKDVTGTEEFLEHLKIDFFKNRIFVFTPKGDVIDLPDGATPVDFAYLVHSDIGNRFNGAKVNDKMVSLEYHLKNGDRCEIITQKNKKPSASWLDFVKTSYAKSKIRSFLK